MNLQSLGRMLNGPVCSGVYISQSQKLRSACWKTIRFQFALTGLLLYLLIPQFAWPAYWIDDFTGEPRDYRLMRQGERLEVALLMPLQAGDELSVLSDTGQLLLLQDEGNRQTERIITCQNGAFIVPASAPPPNLMSNMAVMFNQWISRASEEKIETRALTARGSEPVLLSGASDLENQLIAGLDSLTVYWSGGEPPYRVRLLDEKDHVISERIGIQKNNAMFTGISLPIGRYGLEVVGESSASYVALAVVGADKAPPLYQAIAASHAPEKMKRHFAVMALASQPRWLFQALQLADHYNLERIKQKILNRIIPLPIDESLLKE